MPLFSPYSPYLSAKGSGTRGSPSLFARPLGRRRRALALVVIGIGLVTFFIPLIAINPPVLETTRWSAFRTVYLMYEGRLPEPVCERCGEPLVRSLLALPFEVSVAYLLLVCALGTLFFAESPRTLCVIGAIGSLFCLRMGIATNWAFEQTFYGTFFHVRRVHDFQLVTTLLAVMLFLVYISLTDSLGSQARAN
jgi:hypothetical protein